jgi:SAM-dependent methyltransferase
MARLEASYWWFRVRHRLVRALLDRGRAPDGGLVLDAGCGTGGTFAALRDRWQVVGCDIAPRAVAYCRACGMEMGLVADVGRLSLRDATFAGVVCADVLEHLEDDAAAVAELFRVTRPGGVLAATVPALPRLWGEHDEALGHQRRYTKRRLREVLEGAGWRVECLNYTVSLLVPGIALYRLARRLTKGRRQPRVDLVELPRSLDGLLGAVARADAWLALRAPMPPGASLLALARRPGSGEG